VYCGMLCFHDGCKCKVYVYLGCCVYIMLSCVIIIMYGTLIVECSVVITLICGFIHRPYTVTFDSILFFSLTDT
jgi:hypothetical protein